MAKGEYPDDYCYTMSYEEMLRSTLTLALTLTLTLTLTLALTLTLTLTLTQVQPLAARLGYPHLALLPGKRGSALGFASAVPLQPQPASGGDARLGLG